MEDIHRTGPVDYVLDGVDAQSKFINGLPKGLAHVVKHIKANEAFVHGNGIYVIPKDQHELFVKVLSGDTEGLSSKTINAVLTRADEISEATGRPVLDVVKPSISTYAEVQSGNIDNTMDAHQEDLEQRNEKRIEQIEAEHAPSAMEGLKASAAAAAVGAVVGFASVAFNKYREGKNVFRGDFNAQDWREVGGQTAVASGIGALSGAAVYLMTNCAELSAPLAGAFVAAAKGMAPLVASFHRGEITSDEFIDAGLFVCSDVALIGVCTAAGQTLIPIPVLGGMVGALAGKCLATFLNGQLRGAAKAIEKRLNDFLKSLDAAGRLAVDAVVKRYEKLSDLATRAFDLRANMHLLELSADLAVAHRVRESLILRNEDDVDAFMRE